MKVKSLLQFTENHHFYVYRDFSLSPLDYKMLSTVYQPMIGAFAIGIYTLLYQQIAVDLVGYSLLDQQRKLFLALDLEPNDKGRKFLIEQTSRLEALGLLQTSRRFVPEQDEFIYEYHLLAPLKPEEFFENQHFTMLLRDKVGKYAVLTIREQFQTQGSETLAEASASFEDISVPFYELFTLNSSMVDIELEQALVELAPARETAAASQQDNLLKYEYADIIVRFPRESNNRVFVEGLKFKPGQLASINYVAGKYMLTLKDTCQLLDEEGIFGETGELNIEAMQQIASLHYLQTMKRDDEREIRLHKRKTMEQTQEGVHNEQKQGADAFYYLEVPPPFHGQFTVEQYNEMLQNSPYTFVLEQFFPGSVPDFTRKLMMKLDINYKLTDEVINVLLHYLVSRYKNMSQNFIESIASSLTINQVVTFAQAVEHFRHHEEEKDKAKVKNHPATAGRVASGRSRGKQKPKLEIVENQPGEPMTDEELQEIRLLAKKLGGKGIKKPN